MAECAEDRGEDLVDVEEMIIGEVQENDDNVIVKELLEVVVVAEVELPKLDVTVVVAVGFPVIGVLTTVKTTSLGVVMVKV